MSAEVALALCRFAHDASATLLWGACAYLAFLVPRSLGEDVVARLGSFRTAAVAVAVVSAATLLPIQAGTIGDGWRDAVDPSTVSAVLTQTGVGRAWMAQMAAACVLAVAVLLPGRFQPASIAVAAGLLLATRALSGHAAMHEGWLGLAHRLNFAVHVLAGGAWLGAFLPFLAILRAFDDPLRHAEAGTALKRFSTAGHGAVALVIATGTLNTFLVFGRWPTDWRSPYQFLLALKIALVAVMVVVAVANRYVVVPLVPRRHAQALGTLRTTTVVEMGLGLAVVACVAVFGILEPS